MTRDVDENAEREATRKACREINVYDPHAIKDQLSDSSVISFFNDIFEEFFMQRKSIEDECEFKELNEKVASYLKENSNGK